jgi:pantoate--beta-alanine ligase
VIRTASGLREITDQRRAAGETVGLVPTMGSLHDGHSSLMRRARSQRDLVVVSIFVNPQQFSDPRDLETYPRNEARDLRVCERAKVSAVWAPPVEEVFPPGLDLVTPEAGPVAALFEGASRPGHFEGVLSVVHRLFDVSGPCSAYFGEKDAQQLFLIRRMVETLKLPVEIVACPTERDPDGLALSSRNSLLSPEAREQAACLFLALTEAAEAARTGETTTAMLVALMAREIGATPLASLDYAAVVNDETFEPVDRIGTGIRARALVAARLPGARLIDNLLLPAPASAGF